MLLMGRSRLGRIRRAGMAFHTFQYLHVLTANDAIVIHKGGQPRACQ